MKFGELKFGELKRNHKFIVDLIFISIQLWLALLLRTQQVNFHDQCLISWLFTAWKIKQFNFMIGGYPINKSKYYALFCIKANKTQSSNTACLILHHGRSHAACNILSILTRALLSARPFIISMVNLSFLDCIFTCSNKQGSSAVTWGRMLNTVIS